MRTLEENIKKFGEGSRFEARKISAENLQTMLEAVSYTPSTSNAQPWEIILTETNTGKERLIGTLLDPQFRPSKGDNAKTFSWILQAPLILTIAVDTIRAQAKFGMNGASVYSLIDIGSAVQNILLTAYSLGIQTTIIREFKSETVQDVLGLPKHINPVLFLIMGYSAAIPLEKPRLSLTDIVHRESWENRY